MTKDERVIAALCHVFAACPLWGIVVDFGMWLYYKDSNEKLAFHAMQGVFLQAIFIALFIIALLFNLFFLLVRIISQQIGQVLINFNEYLLVSKGKIVDRVKTYRGFGQCFL